MSAQKNEIVTEFIDSGTIYKNANNTTALIQFEEFDKCIVTSFVGKYTYKVKFKGVEGYVRDRFLLVNEAMMDLYFNYEETQKLKAIKSRGKSAKDLEIIAQLKQDSTNQVEEKRKQSDALKSEQLRLANLKHQKTQDSVAKIKAEEIRLAKIRLENLKHQRQQDSIAKVQAEIAKAEKLKLEQLKQKRIQDSISKLKTEEIRLAKIRLENLKHQRQQDSIAKVKAEIAKAEKLKLEQLKQKRIQDSIAKAKAEEARLEKIRLENLKYQRQQDSIAKVKAEIAKAEKLKLEQLKQKRIQDSITKAKAEEARLEKIRLENLKYQRQQDSIAKAQAEIAKAEKLKLEQLKQKRIQDSIAKAKANAQDDAIDRAKQIEKRKQLIAEAAEKQRLETIEKQRIADSITKARSTETMSQDQAYRNTCHYYINEYDSFNHQQLIITEKYFISEQLNIELLREGSTTKIHFNFSENLGCVDYVPSRRSSVRVILENGQGLTFYHSGSLDCNLFSLKANLPESYLNLLKQSPIKSINLKASKGAVLITDINYKDFFIEKLKCIEY
ncbi:hypothetical protein PW52_10245 [Tamlana sedimentorum]|uniref:Uncharacterized protein n=1 Tax=Neotamlana sedimentorum TaxID=1435349 RepID=A0A0D7W8P8_9FLAO|nr:hypothetical protein [Tamlana sedimentorum]KJD35466.1 hypothetical protein PW52_10245 [Tamlana sedimentorum]